jgi:hypothetical protein
MSPLSLARRRSGSLSGLFEQGRRMPGKGVGGDIGQQPREDHRAHDKDPVHKAQPTQRCVADDRVLVPSQRSTPW